MGDAMTPPVAMTIAGSDSGGNAGLAADLKTFAAHGVHGVFALTVVTAQNTTGIVSAVALDAAVVAGQIDAVVSDFSVAATKTGLLFSEEAVHLVADRAEKLGPLVVDPVLVTSAGEPMLAPDVGQAYIDRLIPLASVLTPNVAEAALLTGIDITTRAALADAAAALVDMGSGAVVVTGYLDDDEAVDALAANGEVELAAHERVDTKNVLGTGCSLSAALTARLARGEVFDVAIAGATSFVLEGLRSGASWTLGAGHGPIDHLHSRHDRGGSSV